MIPARVEVKGFLCYREAQVIDLDACDLWAFSGRNGSGKSAIFDAMTFALFGRHRGGAHGAENLIHADASEFAIAFDFDLGDDRYRIRRSLRKGGRSERQVYRRGPDGSGDDRWPPEPETDSDADLKRWVEENVGLSFDMFTSSILLRQGEADKLLSADPAERFKILAGVVDLARYQRLHGLADDRRRRHRARADELRAQLAGAPGVDPSSVVEAEARLAESESALVAAAAERERLDEAERQAGVLAPTVRLARRGRREAGPRPGDHRRVGRHRSRSGSPPRARRRAAGPRRGDRPPRGGRREQRPRSYGPRGGTVSAVRQARPVARTGR